MPESTSTGRWVRETEPYRAEHGTELHISDALVVRWSQEISKTVHAAESYARLRAMNGSR